ncbi:hypothetical protein PINS_up015165 [Pythium insidiosum]|nr:hypothetical protein PINS_up015165 [Pythium insidiosum]
MWSWLLGGGASPPSSSASSSAASSSLRGSSLAPPPPSTPSRSRLASFLLGNSSSSGSSFGYGYGAGPHGGLRASSLPREFTLANLQRLHVELERALTHALPDADVVELLRVLSEFLIYSDQHRASSPPALGEAPSAGDAGVFFDYFCEKNMLGLLVALGASPPSVAVQVQLLQTLSLLVQNIATRTWLFFLLSNNHVNRLLECPFAVDRDDDVRDWFVTLLKALSLRLTRETVQFFFDSDSQAFPLYEQALRFGRCSETMVQAAVKTLMLNVLRVPDERVRRFLLTHEDMAYFRDVVDHANELALKLQGLLNIWTPTAAAVGEKLEEAVDEYLDHCFFLQDVLEVQLPELCYRVGDWLFTKHIKELLAVSLLPNCCPPPQRVSTKLALYLLSRLLGVLEHVPLVNAIAFLLLSPDAHERCDYSAVALGGGGARRRKSRRLSTSNDSSSSSAGSGGSGARVASTDSSAAPSQLQQQQQTTAEATVKPPKKRKESKRRPRKIVFRAHADGDCNSPVCYLQTRFSHGEWPVDEVERFRSDGSSCFRQSLLALLESSDEALASAAMLVVVAVMENEAVDRSLLRDLGLLPWRLRHQHNHHSHKGRTVDTDDGDTSARSPPSPPTDAQDEAHDEAAAEPQADAPEEDEDAQSSSSSSASETSITEDSATELSPPSTVDAADASHWLVDPMLRVLQRCCDARLLCSQLATRVLLDLSWDARDASEQDADADADAMPRAMSVTQLTQLGDIHSSSAHQVMQSMRGAMADVDLFIYVLEDEVDGVLARAVSAARAAQERVAVRGARAAGAVDAGARDGAADVARAAQSAERDGGVSQVDARVPRAAAAAGGARRALQRRPPHGVRDVSPPAHGCALRRDAEPHGERPGGARRARRNGRTALRLARAALPHEPRAAAAAAEPRGARARGARCEQSRVRVRAALCAGAPRVRERGRQGRAGAASLGVVGDAGRGLSRVRAHGAEGSVGRERAAHVARVRALRVGGRRAAGEGARRSLSRRSPRVQTAADRTESERARARPARGSRARQRAE